MRRFNPIHSPLTLLAAVAMTLVTSGATPLSHTAAFSRAGIGHAVAQTPPTAPRPEITVASQFAATSAQPAQTPTTSPDAAPAPTPDAQLASTRTHRVWWGFYTDAFPGDPTAIDRIAASAGHNPSYVMWYMHWGGLWSAVNLADVRAVIARGATPLITWMSDDPTVGGDAFPLASIAAGKFDIFITGWATALAQAGGPVLLRFDHEMNGSWYPWSPGVGASTAANYVAAWRHVHNVFAAAGATNVRFVWSPNVEYTGSAPLASLYPGDSYVDWTGIDGYNWGSLHPSGWQSPSTVFGATVSRVRGITKRPLMISEVGCAPTPGDKAAWITSFFQYVGSNLSISAFVWFDVNKETDWRFDSTSASLAAFVTGLNNTAR